MLHKEYPIKPETLEKIQVVFEGRRSGLSNTQVVAKHPDKFSLRVAPAMWAAVGRYIDQHLGLKTLTLDQAREVRRYFYADKRNTDIVPLQLDTHEAEDSGLFLQLMVKRMNQDGIRTITVHATGEAEIVRVERITVCKPSE